MEKYTFTYTKKEVLEFTIRIWWEMQRRRPALPAILLLCFVYAFILKRIPYEFLILFIILLAVEIGSIYIGHKKNKFLHERTIWIEDGLLKANSASGYHETPCSQISRIIKSKRLLMLGVFQKKNQPSWFIIPTRVFSCAKEQYDFLESLKNPVSAPTDTVCEPEDFHFLFIMDIDKWVEIETEAWSAFRDKDRHNSKMMLTRIIYCVFVCLLGIWFFYHMGMGSIFSTVAMIFFTCLILLRFRMDPKKSIRKSIQNSSAQSNLLGNWEIRFTASGISYVILQKRKIFMPWTEFSWVAETEHAFYLMRKDIRQFIPVPKECLSGYEQAQAWIQYCQAKGLAPVRIKKAKYIPFWFFIMLLVLALFFCFAAGIWSGFQRSEPGVSYSPALEAQVTTLRSLGLTVPDETIARVARTGYPDEENTRKVIEEYYPYTWLLMDLGAPEYNENFEITDYSKEVFWFDFEGWDLETDYIHVLEGMAALSEGSAIDQVENICVDTTQVNWEEGNGTLTVLLDYNGETLMYPMNVDYDWIDPNVLEIYNDLLKHTDSREHFYAMGDDGQGVIIFFCSDHWAKSFEKMTHITLEEL